MNNYKRAIPIYIGVVLAILFTACESNSTSLMSGLSQDAEMNDPTSTPTLSLQQRDFRADGVMGAYQHQLVQVMGVELQDKIREDRLARLADDAIEVETMGEFYPLHQLEGRAKGSSQLPSRIQVENQRGEPDEFIMAITSFAATNLNAENNLGLEVIHKAQSSSPLYTFLSPDRFYLQDGTESAEQWPVEVEAVSLENVDDRIRLHFNEEGLIWDKLDQKAQSIAQENRLLVLDAVVVESTKCDQTLDVKAFQDCQLNEDNAAADAAAEELGAEGGIAAKSGMIRNLGRGADPGGFQPNSVYLTLKGMRLPYSGDGDGAGEVQMFMDLESSGSFPLQYRYRFDRVLNYTPVAGFSVNTLIAGADRYYPFFRYYSVPDVNFADHYYSFNNTVRYQLPTPNSSHFYHDYVDYFPLINMSQMRGNWRLILIEDDKHYRWHSLRRYGNRIYTKLLNSLNLETDRVEQYLARYNVLSHRHGSSDDIIPRSGVHNISMAAVNSFNNNAKYSRNHVTTSKYMLYTFSSLEE